MPHYKAPLEDIQFVLHDCLKITEHYARLGFEDAQDRDLINAVLEGSAKFASEVISPLNFSGDQQGCLLSQGQVKTPDGFKQAYKQYCDEGWSSLSFDPEYGGQGLPHSLSIAAAEMTSAANASWSMYPELTHGCINALSHHGSANLKSAYLPKLISGVWTGTMCLTESHSGSDLGLIKTRAIMQDEQTYLITGTKIFISAGEHDMSENIIHLVLARIKGSPEGSAGISLFLVPKIMDSEKNTSLTDNNVSCSAIEHKIGIKASVTSVINFENSKGYLIGEVNKGLNCMFTMMNTARLATGVQAYAIADLARQASLDYAKERLQMRSLSGIKAPDKFADPIIVHPDVKRMLFTQKALTEGCRGLAYYTATLVDKVTAQNDPQGLHEKRLSLLTPICKAFMSEMGFESTNHAVQVLGGHGFIVESELEQLVRDSRITLIYEGTNGIQSLDLLGRKILRDKGEALVGWVNEIKEQANLVAPALNQFSEELQKRADEWLSLTQLVAQKATSNRDEVGAAAFDFLMYSGYISTAHILLQQANSALTCQKSENFVLAKQQTVRFYFERILPRIKTHKALILSGNANLNCCDFEI